MIQPTKTRFLSRLLGLALVVAAPVFATDKTPAPDKGKVLFVLTSHDKKGDTGEPTGFYLGEATHPYHELVEAGYTVDFVSPQGGKAPVDGFKLDDAVNKKYWDDPTFRRGIEHTLKPAEVDPAKYAAILYVGGHGAMWDFADNQTLARIAAAIYDKGGVVAAVCHGPAGLLPITLANGQPLVKGKAVAAFTNSEETAVKLDKVVPFLLADALTAKGANHQSSPDFQAKAVVSERLVTGQNPASAPGVGREIVKLLNAAQN